MEIGNLISFNTICPSVLGDRYEAVKLVKKGLGSEFVSELGNLNAKSISVANALGTDVVDVTTANVYKFLDGNGTAYYLLEDWIDQNTVVEGSNVNFTLTIGNINNTDVSIIKSLLAREGYSVISERVNILN